ncbi:unnamed protein product [Blepharisma stoltei]|uniref:Phosphatidic acid phosphatase type 2/haloperoxidase domain-containing protein n=1 Tax=Blepharisma stoltei TaxID=1481888 RepID=A0AAU9JRR5_9CILI|nr:unnamed protein product [Blepharisma stoltei]
MSNSNFILMDVDFYPSSTKNLKLSNIVIGLIVALWLVAVVIEDIMTGDFYDEQVTFSKEIQKQNLDSTINFFKAVWIFIPFVYQLYFLYAHTDIDAFAGMKMIIVVCTLICTANMLAMLYSRPQVYWEHSDVHGWDCVLNWNVPSERSMVSIGCVYYFFTLKLFNCKRDKLWEKAIFIGVNLIWVLFVGFTEIYLGLNGIFDIILSWLYGLLVVVIFIYFDKWINKLIMEIFIKMKPGLIFIHCAFMLGIAVGIILYEFRDAYMPDKWQKKVNSHCPDSLEISDSKDIAQNNLKMVSTLSLSTGALLGMAFSYNKIKQKWWGSVSTWHSIIRLLASWIYFNILNMLIVIIQNALPSTSSSVTDTLHITDLIRNAYIVLFYEIFIYYQMGWMLTYLYPMVMMVINSCTAETVPEEEKDPSVSMDVIDGAINWTQPNSK